MEIAAKENIYTAELMVNSEVKEGYKVTDNVTGEVKGLLSLDGSALWFVKTKSLKLVRVYRTVKDFTGWFNVTDDTTTVKKDRDMKHVADIELDCAKDILNISLIDDYYINVAASFVHSAIEKYLKSCIVNSGLLVPTTNNIYELVKYEEDSDMYLNMTKEEIGLLKSKKKILSEWRTRSREDLSYTADEADVEMLIKFLEVILKRVIIN